MAPAALVVAGGLLIARSVSRSVPRVPWSALAAFGITYVVVILWIGPALERWKVVPDVARWVAAHSDGSTRVGAYRLNRWDPALRFYVERQTTVLDTPEQAAVFVADPAPFYCVMRGEDFDNLVAHGVPIEVVYTRSGMWATSGRALWREGATYTDFVVAAARSCGRRPRRRNGLRARLMLARTYLVSGRVQGVGFRFFAEAAGIRAGLDGWVRNLPDGCVEIFAQGDTSGLDSFERQIRRGPSGARVGAVDVSEAPLGDIAGFDIR